MSSNTSISDRGILMKTVLIEMMDTGTPFVQTKDEKKMPELRFSGDL